MSNGGTAPLGSFRYLSESDVRDCLPPVRERIMLAEHALRAVTEGRAEMPMKIGVHPRPHSLLHAMPAWDEATGAAGVKWVSTYPSNGRLGVRTVDALIILNRADTGQPTALLEAGFLTAVRTAAVSGVAMTRFLTGKITRAAVIGAGLQGGCHVEVLSALVPDVELRIYDRHADRASGLAERATQGGIRRSLAAGSAAEAVEGAQLVVSAAALGSRAKKVDEHTLGTEALIVAVDSDTYVSARTAQAARSFIVDDRTRFMAYVAEGAFPGYPEPSGTLGEVLLEKRSARRSGLTLVTTLGMGIVDMVFAAAVQREAEARGLGVTVARDGGITALVSGGAVQRPF